jgi:hypothetical protein
MITHVKGAKLYFNDKLVGEDARPAPDRRADTEAFLDMSKADVNFDASTALGLYTGTMTFDLESQNAFKEWSERALVNAYMDSGIVQSRLAKIAGRFAPFEFGPPMVYLSNSLRFPADNGDRRWTVMTPSATGKTSTALLRMLLDDEAYAARIRRAMQRNVTGLPQPRNTGIQAVVSYICANWGDYRG